MARTRCVSQSPVRRTQTAKAPRLGLAESPATEVAWANEPAESRRHNRYGAQPKPANEERLLSARELIHDSRKCKWKGHSRESWNLIALLNNK
ncbi:MAG: hypothetical protein ACYS9V_14175 [Planctomycetota bacterium]